MAQPLLQSEAGVITMLWTLIVLLLLFWVLGFMFDVAGGIIHLLLIVAAVMFIFSLVRGRRRVV
jgi:hypothetical protein